MDGEAWSGEARLRLWLEKSPWVTLPGICVGLTLPWLLGFANLAYLPVLGLVVLLALALAFAEDREIRGTFVALWLSSLFVGLVMLLLLFGAGRAAGGPFLGPDAAKFLRGSLYLAREHFRLSAHPIAALGTTDVAHYYLWGVLIRGFHADLFAIQLFSCGITALIGPLIFATGRFIVPRFALLAGTIVALNPELLVLAARDLLKDPSVILSMTAAVWALVRVWRADSLRTRLANAAFAFSMVTYLRFCRFYVEVYLAGAVAAVILLVAIRRRPAITAGGTVAAVIIMSVFAGTELVMVGSGWPSAPWLMYGQIQHVRWTRAMTDYDPGLFERDVRVGSVPGASEQNASSRPPAPDTPGRPAASDVPGRPAAPDAPSRPAAPDAPSRPAAPTAPRATIGEALALPLAAVVSEVRPTPTPTLTTEQTDRLLVPSWTAVFANAIRRLYGPFVWILPNRWELKEILTADYLLYPGMLIWYAVLPLAAVGLFLTLWRTLLGREENPLLMALCFFTVIYFAQYLAINLSYRQRSTLSPVVTVFGFVGLAAVLRVRTWKRWYAVYWVLLAVVAVTHLAVRAFARG